MQQPTPNREYLVAKAATHLGQILEHAIERLPGEDVLVIFDEQVELTRIMAEAYRRAIPDGIFVNFDTTDGPAVREAIDRMKAKDLVVLLQSTNFRLNDFRIRIHLFEHKLKTIEHIHLMRMLPDQYERYIDTLAYDPVYYRTLGPKLQERLDRAAEVEVMCGQKKLVFSGGMEPSKLNIGDYTGMNNIGGTYPIGEVFSEAKDLTMVNGEAMVFGFAGNDHSVQIHEPFTIQIVNGMLQRPTEGPEVFKAIYDLVASEEEPWIREFGFGLNPAIDRTHLVSDITAYERMTGLHLSFGAKHGVYLKEGFKRKQTRYHVDIFIDTSAILLDGEAVFKDGSYQV